MAKKEHNFLDTVQAHVRGLFQSRNSGKHLYHDFIHTQGVVEAAEEIGQGEGLGLVVLEDVLIAAWFHDTGFTGMGKDHEKAGAEHAKAFLTENGFDVERIKHISSLILATKFPANPTTQAEKVICDADLHHVGKKDFEQTNQLFRAELELVFGKVFTDVEWYGDQVDFLAKHHFFTSYAQDRYSKRKSQNILQFHQFLKDAQESAVAAEAKQAERQAKEQEKQAREKEKIAKARAKEVKPDRGVETMFRVTSRNHMELSNMADNKANIMISINAIIISIIVSAMVPKLDKNTFLIIPTFVLLATCLLTIIFATLSTRPKVTGGTFTKDDLKHRRVNLLFFGNFFKMKFEEFNHGMKELMEDREFLYGSMTKDIYYLGQVLGRKYKLVRISYNVFMIGLVMSLVAFAVAFAIWNARENQVPGIPNP